MMPSRARAGTEEWSTFNPEAQELDDESLLDHFLTRHPRAWREEWERAALAIRTAQGCLTSGQWFIHTDLKLRTPLGRRAEFGLLLRQSEDDAESYNYADFQFRFPTRWGTPGAWFRPLYDKSRQDFSFTWDAGADTTAEQLQLAFTLEDVFNNLWAFRQTQVGGLAEPYERRPYEPALRWASHHRRLRVELEGRYLTPSRKRVIDYGLPVPQRRVTIWGTLGAAAVEAELLGTTWGVSTHNQQAFSTDQAVDGSDGRHAFFRREWHVDVMARRRVLPSLTIETHYLYQSRDARHGPPLGPSSFEALDRMGEGELRWEFRRGWIARGGGMYDRVGVAQAGPYRPFTYGTRNESRAFFGLVARFGAVSVAGVEGLELDPEPYTVPWFHHDKGFLQLQATF